MSITRFVDDDNGYLQFLETLADLEWQGADARLKEVCHQMGDDKFPGWVPRWREG